MLVDLSWSPWEVLEQMSSDTGLPIVRSLLGSQQLLTALDEYLESRNATDAAILMESEVGRSNVRVWVHAGLTRESARALKTMRPEPSFYVIVGESGFVMDTYRRRKQYVLNALLQYITEVYSKLEQDLPLVTTKVDCDNLQSEMNGTRDRLLRQFAEDVEMSNDTTFYWDGDRSGLFLRSRFVLSTYKPDDGLQTVATWSADEEYKLLPGAVPWTIPKLDPDSGEQMVNEDGQPLYEGYCVDLIDKLAEVGYVDIAKTL
ncbi:unnamed protein product [Diatraea saccharalis]|uniref:Uncharacterized protein n=1 Tax=Diatraea saccharalis TaxID=40085 RepID=A0A9N9R5Q2_9NEOP|nr:unnamed protein product [Diatraea saccharalis]